MTDPVPYRRNNEVSKRGYGSKGDPTPRHTEPLNNGSVNKPHAGDVDVPEGSKVEKHRRI